MSIDKGKGAVGEWGHGETEGSSERMRDGAMPQGRPDGKGAEHGMTVI